MPIYGLPFYKKFEKLFILFDFLDICAEQFLYDSYQLGYTKIEKFVINWQTLFYEFYNHLATSQFLLITNLSILSQ